VEISLACLHNRRLKSYIVGVRSPRLCFTKSKCDNFAEALARKGVNYDCAIKLEELYLRLWRVLRNRMQTLLNSLLEQDFVYLNDSLLQALAKNPNDPNARIYIDLLTLLLIPCLKKDPKVAEVLNKICEQESYSVKLELIHAYMIQKEVERSGGANLDLPLLATPSSRKLLGGKLNPVLAEFAYKVAGLLKKHMQYGLVDRGDYYSSIISIESPNKLYMRLGKNHITDVQISGDRVELVYRDHDQSRVYFVALNLFDIGANVNVGSGVARAEMSLGLFEQMMDKIALVLALTTSADIMHTPLEGKAEEALVKKFEAVKKRMPSETELRDLMTP